MYCACASCFYKAVYRRMGPNDRSGQLIRASKGGDLSEVKYLVEVCHVDPHSCRDYENDATPLHWATLYGHLDVVRYFNSGGEKL